MMRNHFPPEKVGGKGEKYMSSSMEISTLLRRTGEWAHTHLLSYDTLLQMGILVMIFAGAGIVYRMVSPRMKDRITAMPAAPVFKLALHNFRKQVFPLLALVLLFFVQLMAAFGLLGADTMLLAAASNLLLAWIVIRLALQFIRNGFVRNIFTATIWGMAALSILGILDDTALALDALAFTFGDIRISALSVIKALLAIFFLMYLAGIITTVLDRRIQKITSLSASGRVLLGKVTKVTLITFAFLIAVATAGIDLSLLAVFSGAVGLGVGFGLQKGVSNLFSGMMLLMDKSITPGDIIELPGGAFGWVNQMGARYTEIVTRDNKAFLVPNEDFITQQVINWSHGNRLIRTEVKFGVSYDSDPHLVKKIAEEVASKPDRVVKEPKPACHLVEFGDFALRFKLRFYIEDPEKGITNMHGEVMLALWDAFRAHGIRIPFPRHEVRIDGQPPAPAEA